MDLLGKLMAYGHRIGLLPRLPFSCHGGSEKGHEDRYAMYACRTNTRPDNRLKRTVRYAVRR